jgi:pimeloyl-ACP methyl ester carboxylesterase
MPLVSARGANIYYEVHGGGEPLLMLPGFGSNATVYWANIPALAERFRVIVQDPRGSGRSDAPEGPYTMEMLAEDATAVLDAAGVGRTHVLGTSFGGMVAQHVALEYPDRVRRLVLACTTPGGTRHVVPPPETIATFMAAADITDVAESVRTTLRIHYSDAYAAAHADNIIGRAIKNEPLRSSPVGRAGQSAAARAHDTHDRLGQITAPTLVAHGDQDALVPAENARLLSERIPAAQLRIYGGARHVFFVERANEFNRDVIDFLAQADASTVAASHAAGGAG